MSGQNAIVHTLYLPERLKHNLAVGLEARWLELWSNRKAGYAEDNTLAQREALISDTRQAHALGLISYLPKWADWRHAPWPERCEICKVKHYSIQERTDNAGSSRQEADRPRVRREPRPEARATSGAGRGAGAHDREADAARSGR